MRLINPYLFLCLTTVIAVASESPAGIRTQSWESAPRFQGIAAEDSTVALLPPVAASQAGAFETAEDGTRYLTLRFQSPGAAAVRLHLREMRLPAGARVFVYGVENGVVTNVAGPYENAGSSIDADLWTAAVRGSEAVLELQEGDASIADLPFEIAEIATASTSEIIENRPSQSKELRTSVYRGQPVTHEVVDGLGVFEGDIILGEAWGLPQARANSKSMSRSSIAITGNLYRWPGGFLPYVIDPAMPNLIRITRAIDHWNSVMNGYVKLIPRTSQGAYVYFYRSPSPGTCTSSIGMIGNQQYLSLGDSCATGNIVHEIGHAFGLFHEQSREDRNSHVTINFANIQSGAGYNFNQSISSSDDVGAYDHGSIMHYSKFAFSKNGLSTIDTIPAGIFIGQRDRLSTGDIAAIRGLYPVNTDPQTSVAVAVNTNPSGMPYLVDGAYRTAGTTFNWAPGTTHTVMALNPASFSGYAYKFNSWSDSGAQAHTFVVPAYAATFRATYLVTYQVVAVPVGSGTATITPASADTLYNPGRLLTLKATAATDSCFIGWTNLVAGTPAVTTLMVMKPYSLKANFQSGSVSTVEASIDAAAAGGLSTLSVTAGPGCMWKFSTPASWLRPNSAPPASGSAVLSVTVDPNMTGAPRSTTITIDSRIVTVNQAS